MKTVTPSPTVVQQIRECVKKISDEDMKYIGIRLSQRIGSDLSEALRFIHDVYPELNKVFSTSSNAAELYNMVDILEKHIQDFLSKRFR